MANGQATTLLRHLGNLFGARTAQQLTDAQLVQRFAVHREEASFAALMERHGRLVWAVCRNILRHEHDVEDAFQATFLVLARRAGAIRKGESVASWLYGVAQRTAVRAKKTAAKRREQESRTGRVPRESPLGEAAWRELQAVLDDELRRLPEKYRAPFLLCCLEGRSKKEAARELGWKEGTVSARLAQARVLLRRRLARRGVSLSAVLCAVVLGRESAAAAVPVALGQTTLRAALQFAASQAPACGAALHLGEGVLKTMALTRLKTVTAWLLILGGLVLGAAGLARQTGAEKPGEARQGGAAPAAGKVRLAVLPSRPRKGSLEEVQPDAAEEITVTGRVHDPQGKAGAGARVAVLAVLHRLHRHGVWDTFREVLGRARANRQGRFRLKVTPPPGSAGLDVVAGKAGYGLGWKPYDPEAGRTGFVVRLLEEKVIRGRLVDLQCHPAAGVKLHVVSFRKPAQDKTRPALLPSAVEGARREMPELSIWDWEPAAALSLWPGPATTDKQGRYSLRGIGCNLEVKMVVRDDRFAPIHVDIDTAGKKEAETANRSLPPGCILEGRVTYADTGKGVANAHVTATLGGQGRTDAKGRFRVNSYVPEPFGYEIGKPYLIVSAPAGEPYLVLQKYFKKPRGGAKLTIDLALPRGILVRGQVVEEGSGKPMAGAVVRYAPQQFNNPELKDFDPNDTRTGRAALVTGRDGKFRVACLPGRGFLLIDGPSSDYISRPLGGNLLWFGKPGGQRLYYHDVVTLRLKAGAAPAVKVVLRRGVTLKGRLLGPDGKAVAEAEVLSRAIARDNTFRARASGGRFALPGCDPKQTYPVLFLDARKRLGAMVRLSPGKADGPVTVRLAPCGSARLRFVDAQGKPLANYRPDVRLVLTPGPAFQESLEKAVLGADTLELAAPFRNDSPRTDAQGRITFPTLIPGATYRVDWIGGRKEFTVKSAQDLKLDDITVLDPE
jgi:RNA polymerase sigma factor (sigma-70 family)